MNKSFECYACVKIYLCFVLEPHTLSCYPMTSRPRGICLIINNLMFEKKKKDRHSAVRDEAALHQLFGDELGFDVHVRNDQRNFEMLEVAGEFAAKDHCEYSAFVCFLMSHGGECGTLEGVRGRTIRIDDITAEFTSSRCPSLANKPKLFIIQACRGTSEDPNLLADHHFAADSAMGGHVNDSTLPRSDTPNESDFLYANSTVPGYLSRRDPASGSPFIQVSPSFSALVLVDVDRHTLFKHCLLKHQYKTIIILMSKVLVYVFAVWVPVVEYKSF